MRAYQNAGYSLLELIVALTIVGLLLCLAAPPLAKWQEQQRLRSLQTQLFHKFNKARYMAMVRHSRVTVCPLSEVGHCQREWNGPLTSFLDNNGNRRLDDGEEIISVLYPPSGIRLQWRGTRPNNSIHFSSQGLTFVSNGTMSICTTRAESLSATVVINRQGRVRSARSGARCPP